MCVKFALKYKNKFIPEIEPKIKGLQKNQFTSLKPAAFYTK